MRRPCKASYQCDVGAQLLGEVLEKPGCAASKQVESGSGSVVGGPWGNRWGLTTFII